MASISDETLKETIKKIFLGFKLHKKNSESLVDMPNHQNLIWKFENLCMVIGTDFPIFGGYDSPCTSLRLSETNKPINFLTGFDLWLENLMSNVPDVSMCYHVRGIVEEYQRIKLENLPKLPSSEFSPATLVDMAQNVFNFLTQKALEEGHIYWLFKAKDDDLLKLYDLTSVSQDFEADLSQTDENGQISPKDNSYAVTVAKLMYKVAFTMSKSNYNYSSHPDMRSLLEGALKLLDPAKHSQVYCAASYLLADIFIPIGIDPNSPDISEVINGETSLDEEVKGTKKSKKKKKTNAKNTNSDNDANNCPVFRNKANFEKLRSVRLPVAFGRIQGRKRLPTDIRKRCQESLSYVIQAIKCVKDRLKTKEKASDEEPRQADSSQAIPLPYYPTSEEAKQVFLSNSEFLVVIGKESFIAGSWEQKLLLILLRKMALINHVIATLAVDDKKLGVGLYHLQITIACWMAIEKYSGKESQEILPLRIIVGDCYGNLAQLSSKDPSELKKHRQGQKKISSSFKAAMIELADLLEEDEIPDFSVPLTGENCLDQAIANYKAKGYDTCARATYIQRCLAGVWYEKAILKIPAAEEFFSKNEKVITKGKRLIEESISLLNACLPVFEEFKDPTNVALIHSNLGTCYRLSLYHTIDRSEPYVISKKEREICCKAVKHLKLGISGTKDPEVKKDLAKYLADTAYKFGKILIAHPSEGQTQAQAVICGVEYFEICISAIEPNADDIDHHRMYSQACFLAAVSCVHPQNGNGCIDAMKKALEVSRNHFKNYALTQPLPTFDVMERAVQYVIAVEKALKKIYPNKDLDHEKLLKERKTNFNVLYYSTIRIHIFTFKAFKEPLSERQLEICEFFKTTLQRCLTGIYSLVKKYKIFDQAQLDTLHQTYAYSLRPFSAQDILPRLEIILDFLNNLLLKVESE